MVKQNTPTSSLDQLVNEYRTVHAPAALLREVINELEEKQARSLWWMPVAGALACIGLLAVIFIPAETTYNRSDQSLATARSMPNMSSLSEVFIDRPTGVSLSQVKIRSIGIPTMPRAPQNETSRQNQPENNHEANIRAPKESDNVYS